MITLANPVFLNSSNLDAAGFQDDTLYVRFKKDGACYAYTGACYTTFDAIVKAESPGQYFHRTVKTCNLPYTKLDYDPFSSAVRPPMETEAVL